ncbi:MAG: HYR domain-containing protein, partial [Salegentibacter sp.]|uniref:HYR domain-containing protein n=1 Tax=Salegentibacter sp. TaxID=1903072 RepID=UPI00287072AF
DDQAPVIAQVEPINTTADADSCGAIIEITAPQVSDNCSEVEAMGTRDDNETLDAEYPVGTTTITWAATDENGNDAEPVEQTITVTDDQAPVIAQVEPINTTADADSCGAMIEITAPQVSDNCSEVEAVGTRDDNEALDAEYPVGTTTITWTATDENGNDAQPIEQTVTVTDDQAPVIAECPIDLTLSADEGGCSASEVELGMPEVTDNCDSELSITNDAPEVFELGETTVTWTVTDAAGNETTCTQTVTVEDNEAPVIAECPADLTLSADEGSCSASEVDLGLPQVTDNCDSELSITNDAPEVFELGETIVTWTVTDAAGNETTCTQTVTVEDNEAPVIAQNQDISVNTDTDACSPTVNYQIPAATDNCGEVQVELTEGMEPGSEFPVGTTNITYTATDGAGNSSSSSFSIIVIDNEAPAITCPEDLSYTVEMGTSGIQVDYENPAASDNCSDVSLSLTEGFASGEEFPVGVTTVTWTATDASENSSSCTFTVTVEEEEIPEAPEAPVVEVIQPDCILPLGTILVETGENLTYSIDGENYQAAGEFNDLEPGTYEVTAKDEYDQVSEATIVILEQPVAEEIETTTISLCTEDSMFDLFELLEGDYDSTGEWIDTNNTGALEGDFIDPSMLSVGNYSFEYRVEDSACPVSATVTVNINDDCVVLPCGLEDIQSSISKAVTPNGDNRNDYFEIDFADECGFTYEVMIFNRWGAKIFKSDNYQNNWDGQSNKSATSSNQLPSGTYYYILKIRNSGFEPIQGYIYLGTK